MGMWNDTCKCIDENWKALKARIQASITGITVNGTTHYQNDGTGICDLGEIRQGDAIVSIEGTAVGHVQTLKTTDSDGNTGYVSIGQFDGTQFDVTVDSETGIPQFALSTDADSPVGKAVIDAWGDVISITGTSQLALMMQFNSLTEVGHQLFAPDASYLSLTKDADTGQITLSLSDDAKNVADNAMMFINPGKGSSSDGQLEVPAFYGPSMTENRTLIFKAGEYLSITDGDNPTLDISDDTIALLNNAKETADNAYTLADTANTAALNAYDLAHSANTKANAAYTGFGTSVVGSNLEATLDKNDGTSETKYMFTAGDGLEWSYKRLNAKQQVAYLEEVEVQNTQPTLVNLGYSYTTNQLIKSTIARNMQDAVALIDGYVQLANSATSFSYAGIYTDDVATCLNEWLDMNAYNMPYGTYEMLIKGYQRYGAAQIAFTTDTDVTSASFVNEAIVIVTIDETGYSTEMPEPLHPVVFANASSATVGLYLYPSILM